MGVAVLLTLRGSGAHGSESGGVACGRNVLNTDTVLFNSTENGCKEGVGGHGKIWVLPK